MVTVRSLTRAPANPSTRPVKRRHSALSQPRVRRDLCNTALADDNPFSMEDVLDMASYLTRSHNVWTVKPGGVLKFENGDARLCIHNFGYQSVVLTDLQVAAGTNKSLDSCCSHLDSDATW